MSHIERLEVLSKGIFDTWKEMLEDALTSGALSEDMKEENYLLTKAVIYAWCKRNPCEPLLARYKKDFDNLSLFI